MSSEKKEQKVEYDIARLANDTRDYWKFKPRSDFHCIISCIISQRIKIEDSRSILKKLYILLNENEFTRENICSLTNDELLDIGITTSKLSTIRDVCKLEDITEKKLISIKGIGPWTIKAWKLMMNKKGNVILDTDKYILARCKELCNETSLTFLNDKDDEDKRNIINFLWRIKPEGIIKIKNQLELTRLDFL